MSKGNPIVKLRLSPDLLGAIEKAIANRQHIRRDDENTLSEWIRGAIVERLDKLERGRGRREKRKRNGGAEPEETGAGPSDKEESPAKERKADDDGIASNEALYATSGQSQVQQGRQCWP